MRILFVTPHLLVPPDSGAKRWVFNLLSYLNRKHECDLIQFATDDDNPVSWLDIEKTLPGIKVLRTLREKRGRALKLGRAKCLLRGTPAAMARYQVTAVRQLMLELPLERYDVVCFYHFTTGQHRALAGTRPTVLLAVDATSLALLKVLRIKPLRPRLLAEALLIAKIERQTYPKFDSVAVVSPIDARWLRRLKPEMPVEVVPVSVENELFDEERRQDTPKSARILCWASLSNENVAASVAPFIERAWPRIRTARPEAELVVWSRGEPHRSLKHLLTRPGVRHQGFVDDWHQPLRDATLLVYPQVCGWGIQTKVQVAMAMGVPVVMSPSACSGLPIESGRNSLLASSPSEFATACLSLLDDEKRRGSMGDLARESLRKDYSVGAVGARFMKALDNAIERFKNQAHS